MFTVVLSTRRSDPGDAPADATAEVTAAVAGDATALRAVLERLLPRVRNLVRYLSRGDQEADDIAQDALEQIVLALPGYRGEGALESWADRVVARVTFAALRKHRRRAAPRVDAPDLAVVPDPGAQPDDYLARRRAVQLLDVLSLEQRHALVLHHAVGMSVPEIADELGASPDTIKSRLRLGTARLRALHGDTERGDGTGSTP
jgi:RNA polymerase sigma-70 factor (ECF subfamily)